MTTDLNKIYKQVFNTYGEALEAVLSFKGMAKRELARAMAGSEGNLSSLESAIYRWTKTDMVPSPANRKVINTILHISIDSVQDGWTVSPDIDGILDAHESSLAVQGLSDTSRAELLAYVQGRIQSLSSELEELARLLMTLRKDN